MVVLILEVMLLMNVALLVVEMVVLVFEVVLLMNVALLVIEMVSSYSKWCC